MGVPRSPSSASLGAESVDLADDLLKRLDQALAGADESDSDVSFSENTNASQSMASPPSLSYPPSRANTPFARPATGPFADARSLLPSAPREEKPGRQDSRASSVQAANNLAAAGQKKKRPKSVGAGGLRCWGDGDEDDDDTSCRDADEEEAGPKMLLSLEIRAAVSLPAAMERCTGECYVELQRRTQRGNVARLNPAQSRVRSVKTSRQKRTWGEDKADRVINWHGGQCIEVEVCSKDCLIFSLWDYKTIGACLKVGYARLDCSDVNPAGERHVHFIQLSDRAGQGVIGSNGHTAQISVAVAAVPFTPQVPVVKEWSEDATTEKRVSPPPSLLQLSRSCVDTTPTLDAVMLKLGSHCAHGGEALSTLGLDSDGRVSARQIAACLERLGCPKLDLEVLGRELQSGRY